MKKIIYSEIVFIIIAWLLWLTLYLLVNKVDLLYIQLNKIDNKVSKIQTTLDKWFIINVE